MEDIAKYRDLLETIASSGFNPSRIVQHVQIEGDNAVLKIPMGIDVPSMGITIVGIRHRVPLEIDVENNGSWMFMPSDLGLIYSVGDDYEDEFGDDWDDDEGLSDRDDQLIDYFYTDGNYLDEIMNRLVSAGFSQEAANSVGQSERGMQDVGRASYDALDIEDEVRLALLMSGDETIENNILSALNIHDGNLEAHKDQILRWMLQQIKSNHGMVTEVRFVLQLLSQHGIKWPELEVISKTPRR